MKTNITQILKDLKKASCYDLSHVKICTGLHHSKLFCEEHHEADLPSMLDKTDFQNKSWYTANVIGQWNVRTQQTHAKVHKENTQQKQV